MSGCAGRWCALDSRIKRSLTVSTGLINGVWCATRSPDMPDATTDKSPYLQCRCNKLSPHGTCHLKPTSSNVSALIAKCNSLFSVFCHFLDRKIKNRKFMNSFIRPKNKRRKILKNAFFWCRKRKIKRNSVGLYNNVLVIQPTHTTDKSCYWLWLAKAKTFSVNHIPTGIYLWCRCSAQ